MFSLIQHCTEYFNRTKVGDPKSPTLWPSEATAIVDGRVVGKCRRATFLRYAIDLYHFTEDESLRPLIEPVQDMSETVDPYMQWIWKSGELYEDYCVELSKLAGVYIDAQVPIYYRPVNLSGKIDLLCINPYTGKKFVAEMKSVYGHNANYTLGKPVTRYQDFDGSPKDSNLMQIALYDWKWAAPNPEYENSRLVYGARDTGRYAEYEVRTVTEDNITYIEHRVICPGIGPWIRSPITITSILEQYRYVLDHIERRELPPKDYEIQYSDQRINELLEAGELSKIDTERVQKRNQQIAEGKQKINKQIVKGDWNCGWCSFKRFCWPEAE